MMEKTKYKGIASDYRDDSTRLKNFAEIVGRALPGKSESAEKADNQKLLGWKKEIARQVREKLRETKIDRIDADAVCNLYISFFIHSHNRPKMPDTDNLLKGFLDPLQDKYGYNNQKLGGGLVKDDNMFRGIRAEREIVPKGELEKVRFKYLITKTFKIIEVWEVAEKKELESYRSYWEDPIQVIKAREEGVVYAREEFDIFIDNAYGAAHVTKETKDKFPEVIPGYNWKKGTVEGCMVFKRKHERKEADMGKDLRFWWLKKWSNHF